jgi:thermostable 8-oxoguanine DNA glycosylase
MKIPKMYKIILLNVKKADEEGLSKAIQFCFKYDEDAAKLSIKQGQKQLRMEFQGFSYEIAEYLEVKFKEFNQKYKLNVQSFIEEDKETSNG